MFNPHFGTSEHHSAFGAIRLSDKFGLRLNFDLGHGFSLFFTSIKFEISFISWVRHALTITFIITTYTKNLIFKISLILELKANKHAKFAETSTGYVSSLRLTPSTSISKAGNVLQKGNLNMACVHKRVLKQ